MPLLAIIIPLVPACDEQPTPAPPAETRSAAEAEPEIQVMTPDGRKITLAEFQKEGEKLSQSECIAALDATKAHSPIRIATGLGERPEDETTQAFCARANLSKWSPDANRSWRCQAAATDFTSYAACDREGSAELREFISKYDARAYLEAKPEHRHVFIAEFLEKQASTAPEIRAVLNLLHTANAMNDALAGVDHCITGVLDRDSAVLDGLTDVFAKGEVKKMAKKQDLGKATTACAAFFVAMAKSAAE